MDESNRELQQICELQHLDLIVLSDGSWWFCPFLVLHASWQKFQMTRASNNSRPSFNPCCKVHLHVSHHLISSKSEMDDSAFGIWSYLQAEAYYKHISKSCASMRVSEVPFCPQCLFHKNVPGTQIWHVVFWLQWPWARYPAVWQSQTHSLFCPLQYGGRWDGSDSCSMIPNAFHSASVVQHANTTPRYYTHSKCSWR